MRFPKERRRLVVICSDDAQNSGVVDLLRGDRPLLAQVTSPHVADQVDYPKLGQGWEQGPIVDIDSANFLVKVHEMNGMDAWFGYKAVRPATAATRAPGAPPMTGTGLVTKQEILSYVQANELLNGHYTQSPEVCKVISLAVKARGA